MWHLSQRTLSVICYIWTMNIRINYLYHDAGNYKAYDTKVFLNKRNRPINEVEQIIKRHLIDGEYFYANEWSFRNLYPQTPTIEDPTWHELLSIEETDEKPEGDIELLLEIIKLK